MIQVVMAVLRQLGGSKNMIQTVMVVLRQLGGTGI